MHTVFTLIGFHLGYTSLHTHSLGNNWIFKLKVSKYTRVSCDRSLAFLLPSCHRAVKPTSPCPQLEARALLTTCIRGTSLHLLLLPRRPPPTKLESLLSPFAALAAHSGHRQKPLNTIIRGLPTSATTQTLTPADQSPLPLVGPFTLTGPCQPARAGIEA